ncbi:protein PAIR1-like isoform X2 [Lolium rigidum]|uniref:protein PAIR1-like isoform X2 n=1 Tax=Lolium rigidum TaxID=89674 RepID=UPI001F5C3BE9|nr:protein PAIR1-like isoform X2 [Lolium rigidum]XP_047076808.1 protein PAIR1-like isoform X2 [Lolium rigidum]
MGMVLDSVQNDVMHLNRAMKEVSLDCIQKKFVLVETSLQQILKGQDDLKALLEGSTKSNPDQMSALNNHTSKLDEILSTLSILKQMQEDLRQLKGDIFRIFTKEMEGIVRAISSLNSRPDAVQAPTVCVLVTQLIKCTTGSLVRVAYLLCFNRYNAKYSR